MLYRNSLSIAFLSLFALSWLLHAVSGAREFSSEEVAHGAARSRCGSSCGTSQFWFESLQNWQSEFLAVGALILATIYLRQQGSSQSKPVAAPHRKTGH